MLTFKNRIILIATRMGGIRVSHQLFFFFFFGRDLTEGGLQLVCQREE